MRRKRTSSQPPSRPPPDQLPDKFTLQVRPHVPLHGRGALREDGETLFCVIMRADNGGVDVIHVWATDHHAAVDIAEAEYERVAALDPPHIRTKSRWRAATVSEVQA